MILETRKLNIVFGQIPPLIGGNVSHEPGFILMVTILAIGNYYW